MSSATPKKVSGFTLFPTPPTPPVKPAKHRFRRKSFSSRASSKTALSSTPEHEPQASRQHERERTVVPASFKLDKTLAVPDGSVTAKPATSFLREITLQQSTPSDATLPRASNLHPDTPENIGQRSGQKPQNKLRALLRRVRNRRANLKQSKDQAQSESPQTIRPTDLFPLDQVFGSEDGKVDRKRLSMYLGVVLNSAFEVPNLQATNSTCCLHQQHDIRSSSEMFKGHKETGTLNIRGGQWCACSLGTVICQCSSSSEFRSFNQLQSTHKPAFSISSTQCQLHVPRARFSPTVLAPKKSELLSAEHEPPPGLSHSSGSSKYSDSLDWSNCPQPSETAERSPISSTFSSSTPSLRSKQNTQPQVDAMPYVRHTRMQSSSRPFRMELSPMLESSEHMSMPVGADLVPKRTSSWKKTLRPAPLQSRNHNSTNAGPRVESPSAKALAKADWQPANRIQHRRKTSAATRYTRPATPRRTRYSVYAHNHQVSNSSAGSSVPEILEADTTARIARARSVKSIVITPPKRTASISIKRSPPYARSEYWLRVEREQNRRLTAVREQRRDPTQNRPPIPVRNPKNIAGGKRSPVVGKRSSSLAAKNHGLVEDIPDTASTRSRSRHLYSSRAALGRNARGIDDPKPNISNGSPTLGNAQVVIG